MCVFDFSDNYFRYFAKDGDRAQCPNAMYVACTRASGRLYLAAEQAVAERLPFLKVNPLAGHRTSGCLP